VKVQQPIAALMNLSVNYPISIVDLGSANEPVFLCQTAAHAGPAPHFPSFFTHYLCGAQLMLERKIISSPALDLRDARHALQVEPDGTFEGYASLFGIVDMGGDEVAPGAFARSLQTRGARAVRMLWQHDPSLPIGSWVLIKEDQRGLRVKGRLNLAVSRARETLALLKEGAVDGLSIGFRVKTARKSAGGGIRRLLEVDLWEISIVTFPMLPQARITSVKQRAAFH
jgi:hypothetical protein